MNPAEDLPDEVRDPGLLLAAGLEADRGDRRRPGVNLVLAFVLLFVFYGVVGPHAGRRRRSARSRSDFPAQGVLHAGRRAGGGRRQARRRRRSSRKRDRRAPLRRSSRRRPAARPRSPRSSSIERDGKLIHAHDDAGLRPGRQADAAGLHLRPTGPHKALPARRGAATRASTDFWFITKQTVEPAGADHQPQQRKQITASSGSYEVTRQTILHRPGDVVVHPARSSRCRWRS